MIPSHDQADFTMLWAERLHLRGWAACRYYWVRMPELRCARGTECLDPASSLATLFNEFRPPFWVRDGPSTFRASSISHEQYPLNSQGNNNHFEGSLSKVPK
jgi:hypothetical protein